MDVNTRITVGVVFHAMRHLELDPLKELSAIGFSSREADADGIPPALPREAYRRLWSRLIDASADPAFGVLLAQQLPGGSLGLPEWTAISAPTVGEGLAALAELGTLLHTRGCHAVEVDADAARFTYCSFDRGDGARGVLGWSFAYLARRLREVTQGALEIREIHFGYPRPPHAARLESVLGCALRFDAPKTALVLDRAALSVPLPTTHAETHRALRAIASRTLQPELSIEARVLGALREGLAEGELPSLAAVAKSMGTSARSLQRALGAGDTSFRALVHRARMEQAESWLQDPRRSITEVALDLGYSDTSAFCRAFRRHFGESAFTRHRRGKLDGTPDAR